MSKVKNHLSELVEAVLCEENRLKDNKRSRELMDDLMSDPDGFLTRHAEIAAKFQSCEKCELRPIDYPRPERVKFHKTADGLEYCFDCYLIVGGIQDFSPPQRTELQKAALDHRGMP